MKGNFCRTPSIGFNGHRYSNLFDGGSSSFNPSFSPPFSSTLISFLSLTLSSLRVFSPRRKPLHVTGACYRGLARARREKEFASRSFFFLRLRPSILAVLDLERKPRRQMRASARGNCSSSIFRSAFSSPEKLDLEERDGVALHGPSMRTKVLKRLQWAGGFLWKYVMEAIAT